MPRLASSLSYLFVPVFSIASFAHADLDLQFGNMTALDIATNTFSIDVQVTGIDPDLAGYQMNIATSGMQILFLENLSELSFFDYSASDDVTFVFSDDPSGGAIEADPGPIGLYRMDLLVTQFSGPLTIELYDLMANGSESEPLVFGQDSYSLTIPAPASFVLLVGGVAGISRRRAE